MHGTLRPACCLVMAVLVAGGMAAASRAADQKETSLASLRAEAIRQAAARVAPSVVTLETTGGAEQTGSVRRGSGIATGVIVSPSGLVVTSLFSLAHHPDAILVTLASGEKGPAKIVATDYARRLVLLQLAPSLVSRQAQPLPVPVAAEPSRMRVGETVVAMGRTLGAAPTLSQGILSATERAEGTAVQTDAKVSPLNYGGPLVNLSGEVMGILLPLSPGASETAQPGDPDAVAGVDFYDAGIGFAIPFDAVLAHLPRWQSGDLKRGIVGIEIGNAFRPDEWLTIKRVAWRSPAAQAGIKAGDRIVSVNGKPIEHPSELNKVLGTRYAGDGLRLGIDPSARQADAFTAEVELAGELPKFRRPYMGFAVKSDPKGERVRIESILAGSPAATAGWQPGDEIARFAGEPVTSIVTLRERVGQLEIVSPGEQPRVPVELMRDGKPLSLPITPTLFPVELPAMTPLAKANGKGAVENWDGNQTVYRPSRASQENPAGVLFVAMGSSQSPAELREEWKAVAEENNLAVVPFIVPGEKSPPPLRQAWSKMVERTLERASKTDWLDRRRWYVVSDKEARPLVHFMLRGQRAALRGVVLISSPPLPLPAAQPDEAIALLMATESPPTEWEQKELRQSGNPVNLTTPGATLPATVGRWIAWIEGF